MNTIKNFWSKIASRFTFIIPFLAIVGPGIITANVDNDVGGIATYSIVGASYGYQLIWLLIIITIALAVVQEMAARMGVVTGKGLAALIRENFGIKITFYAMMVLIIANLANTVAEFAGIAAGGEIFGVSRYISVPVAAFVVWILVILGSYKYVEKVLLFFCLIYVTYIISGLMTNPPWGQILHETVLPKMTWDTNFLIVAIATIGTTIAPWMQFFQQSIIAEKRIKIKDYKYEQLDTHIGAFLTNIVAFFIIIACAGTLYKAGIKIESASDAAIALQPLAGKYASGLFAIGLINAGVMASMVLPVSTAYAVSEGFGWESAIGRKFKEAPKFFILYTLFIIIGACIILFTKISLIKVMLFSQTANGILLPVILILMLLLCNNPKVMGKHVNKPGFNVIAWVTVIVTIILTLMLILTSVFPNIFT